MGFQHCSKSSEIKMSNKGILDSLEDSSEILQEFIEKIAKQPTKK